MKGQPKAETAELDLRLTEAHLAQLGVINEVWPVAVNESTEGQAILPTGQTERVVRFGFRVRPCPTLSLEAPQQDLLYCEMQSSTISWPLVARPSPHSSLQSLPTPGLRPDQFLGMWSIQVFSG